MLDTTSRTDSGSPEHRASQVQLPMVAEVVEFVPEAPQIFTLRLRLVDEDARTTYGFAPGQFNMLGLFGVGEVPISIVSDPQDEHLIDHTIRVVGRVSEGLAKLKPGDQLGLRGPFGRGWPVLDAEGKDVMIVTGGLGCAPVVAAINYMLMRREQFGHLTIVQGVKHSDDLIWRARYAYWDSLPNTQVLIAADHGGVMWPYHHGQVTDLLAQSHMAPDNALAMLCGPEGMMLAAIRRLVEMGVAEPHIYLSMERNMQCAAGHCGHCQFGAAFICKDGPVFAYPQVKQLLGKRGI